MPTLDIYAVRRRGYAPRVLTPRNNVIDMSTYTARRVDILDSTVDCACRERDHGWKTGGIELALAPAGGRYSAVCPQGMTRHVTLACSFSAKCLPQTNPSTLLPQTHL